MLPLKAEGARHTRNGQAAQGANRYLSEYLECLVKNLEGQAELIRHAIDLHPELSLTEPRKSVDSATRPFFKAHDKFMCDIKAMAEKFRCAENYNEGNPLMQRVTSQRRSAERLKKEKSPDALALRDDIDPGNGRDSGAFVNESDPVHISLADIDKPAMPDSNGSYCHAGDLAQNPDPVQLPEADGEQPTIILDDKDAHTFHDAGGGVAPSSSSRSSGQVNKVHQQRVLRASTDDSLGSHVHLFCQQKSNSAQKLFQDDSTSLADHLHGRGRLEKVWYIVRWLVKHRRFEMFFAVIILLNSVVISMETQYTGSIMTRDSGNWGGVSNKFADDWPLDYHNATLMFYSLECIFGILFTIELVLKMIGLAMDFWYDFWSYVDVLVVTTWLMTIPSGPDTDGAGFNATWIRMLRLGRLLRIIKLMKTIRGMDALNLIFTALEGGASTLSWAIILLFTAQLFCALFINQVLTESFWSDPNAPVAAKEEIFLYFGTCTRAILSMFEITLANWPPIVRAMQEHVSHWWTLFFLLHKLVIGFAVVGIINGVFMQETFKVASLDDRIMVRQKEKATAIHAKKMTTFFELADEDGNGTLSLQEFRDFTNRPEIKTWLAAMDLDVRDVDNLWFLIDDGDGEVTLQELITGVSRLKGNARAIDLAMLSEKRLLELTQDIMIETRQVWTDIGTTVEALEDVGKKVEVLNDLGTQVDALDDSGAKVEASPTTSAVEASAVHASDNDDITL